MKMVSTSSFKFKRVKFAYESQIPCFYSPVRVFKTTVISTSFGRSNWNLDVAHLQYIFVHCVKFQNPRTEASYQSAADKVLYKYPNISQIRLSSNPRNFDNVWTIKLKPQRCISAIYIVWSFRTLGQMLHTKRPRNNYCTSNVNRRTDGQTDG